MALKQITAADFNAAIKKLTTSDASVWWKTLGTTEEGTELCFVMGWSDGYEEDSDLYQQDGYTLCSKIGYKPSNLMVMDYTDFNMPYDKKTADVWDTDMSVGKGEVTDDAFDVKWYNDEAEAIWKKYGNPDKEGKTALDLMESKKKESTQKDSKKHTCSMQKKKESLAKKSEANVINLLDDEELTKSIEGIYRDAWKECCDSADEQEKPYYEGSEWYIEEFTPMTVESTQKSMYDYVAGGKYSMPGNFKQIDMDWDHDHEGGIKFSDLKKKLLAGTQDKDTEEFSHWGIDWFFDAFGTFGLKYNFKDALTDSVYDDMREDGVVESKKQEADGEDSQATYEVCFDYVQTMCQSVKANSVEDAVEKARRLISKDMQVCEIWCNEKTLPNGTKVYLDGKDSDEQSYTEGGWDVV